MRRSSRRPRWSSSRSRHIRRRRRPRLLPAAPAAAPAAGEPADFSGVHAGPSVRRLARELEVDLTAMQGTGEKGRITKEDVKAF